VDGQNKTLRDLTDELRRDISSYCLDAQFFPDEGGGRVRAWPDEPFAWISVSGLYYVVTDGKETREVMIGTLSSLMVALMDIRERGVRERRNPPAR
jgi:hypothetical protein